MRDNDKDIGTVAMSSGTDYMADMAGNQQPATPEQIADAETYFRRRTLHPDDSANGERLPTPAHLQRPGWNVAVYHRDGNTPAARVWAIRAARENGDIVYSEMSGGDVEWDRTLPEQPHFGQLTLADMIQAETR